jgi:uncharacterized Zn finger protein
MQDTTFLELTHTTTRRAAARARQMRPRVSIISVPERTYRVSGSQGDHYTVRLSAGNGRLLGSCECKGAQGGKVCYHIAACAGVATGIKQARRLALERAAGLRRVGKRVFAGAIEI